METIILGDSGGASQRHRSVQATRLIHEHFGTIATFAYSRGPLKDLIKQKFLGEWKYLDLALFEIPEQRATRALIELGLYFRIVDDAEKLSEYHGDRDTFGQLVNADGSTKPLRMRDVANKIIHAERYEWNIASTAAPSVTCIAERGQDQRGYTWKSASINLDALAALCGTLMS